MTLKRELESPEYNRTLSELKRFERSMLRRVLAVDIVAGVLLMTFGMTMITLALL